MKKQAAYPWHAPFRRESYDGFQNCMGYFPGERDKKRAEKQDCLFIFAVAASMMEPAKGAAPTVGRAERESFHVFRRRLPLPELHKSEEEGHVKSKERPG